MKISSSEYGKTIGTSQKEKILPEEKVYWSERKQPDTKKIATPLEKGMKIAQEAMEKIPDVREEMVAELKEKIEKGTYSISGTEIADMMLRRLSADRIR